ncbi:MULTISPECIES: hypothetical protein [unclassified Streptomyces]
MLRHLEGKRYQEIQQVWWDLVRHRRDPEAVMTIVRNASVVPWESTRGDS